MRRTLRLAVAAVIAAASVSFLLATAGDVGACAGPPAIPGSVWCAEP